VFERFLDRIQHGIPVNLKELLLGFTHFVKANSGICLDLFLSHIFSIHKHPAVYISLETGTASLNEERNRRRRRSVVQIGR
jgi:hypothetical protein